jgi:hypothetical protein
MTKSIVTLKKNVFNRIHLQVFSILIVFILFSCKKNSETIVNDELSVDKAKMWLETTVLADETKLLDKPTSELPEKSYERVLARMNRLAKKLDWGKSESVLKNGIEIIAVPLLRDRLKTSDNLFANRVFLFFKEKNSQIALEVIELYSKKKSIIDVVGVAVEAFENKVFKKKKSINSVDADVFFYNEKYKSLASYKIKDKAWFPNQIFCINKNSLKPSELVVESVAEGCEQWGVFMMYYDDYGNFLYETLLYTYWVGNCWDGAPADSGESSDPYGFGGGTNGGSEPQDPCSLSSQQASSVLNSLSISVSSSGGHEFGVGTAPDMEGIIRKPIVVHRDGVDISYGFGYRDSHELFFKGILFKTGNTSPWKWQSLSFERVARVSGSTPPCFSNSTTASVSGPIISNDKSYAEYSAIVGTTITISCLGGPVMTTETNVFTNIYYANSF